MLTGADWQASGWGDLPVPGGLKRRDGSVFRPPYPALAKDRVRWVGDYVAFVVAETYHQALDAAELIEVDYEPLPAIVSTAQATAPGAPRVWDECPDNIGFVQLFGDKAATDAAFARADHVVKHHFVINRVTAATMEPRGCIGDYNATDGRYTIYTTLQRAHPFRAELAPILKVPESKIRVVAGDIGGSFGMKSAVYNEVALVLLASKLVGRPVKWTSTRSESFLCDAQARDNVTDAELALDKDGNFVAMRVKTMASIGAYLQTGMPAFTGNIGTLAGVYRTPAIHADVTAVFTHTNPVRPYRGNGRPEAAYVIERLVDLAADELGIDPAELRRRNYIAPAAMPFKTGLTFTYDSGEFEKSMDMALKLADFAGFEQRRAEARKRGKLRGIGLSNTIERAAAAGLRGRRDPLRQIGRGHAVLGQRHPGPGARDHLQADRMRPARARSRRGPLHPGRHRPGLPRRRHRRLALGHHRRVGGRRRGRKDHAKAKKIAAHLLEVEAADVNFADGVFSSPKTNRTLTIKEVAKEAIDPARLPNGMEVGLIATATYAAAVQNFPNGCHICELEIDEDTGEVEIVRYSVVDDVGTVLNPLLLKGQIVGGVAQGVGQILMEDIRFDGDGQILTGSFMDYAMPRADRHQHGRGQEQSGADQDQSARRQGRRRGRLRRRDAGGRQRAGRRAVAPRRPPHRDAGDARAAVARDERSEWRLMAALHYVTPKDDGSSFAFVGESVREELNEKIVRSRHLAGQARVLTMCRHRRRRKDDLRRRPYRPSR